MKSSQSQQEALKRHSKLADGRLSNVDGVNIIDQIHLARYYFASRYIDNCIVLDIASGIGYGSSFLAEHGNPARVTGVDVSPAAFEKAVNTYKRDNLEFRLITPENIPFPDETFDVVVSFETVEHAVDLSKFLLEINRVLKKNGTLIISTPNKRFHSFLKKKPWNPHHTVELYPDEFKKLLTDSFSRIEFWGGQEFLSGTFKELLKYNWVEFKYYNINNSKIRIIPRVLSSIRSSKIYASLQKNRNRKFASDVSAWNAFVETRSKVLPWTEGREPFTFVAVCRK